jgi:hypothetical protein
LRSRSTGKSSKTAAGSALSQKPSTKRRDGGGSKGGTHSGGPRRK